MKSIKIGVVEDEVIIADTIINSLEQLGYEVTEPCLTYTHAIEMVETEEPDLVLLDINLAGKKTGIDVAKVLNDEYNIPFIFLTSNSDPKTIEAAKLVNPHAYLVKPFSKDDLFTSIEIALSNFNTHKEIVEKGKAGNQKKLQKVIFAKVKDRFHAIKVENILYAKSDHVYVEIVTAEETYIIRSSLTNFLEKLPSANFFQTHRRYIINLTYLSDINFNNVIIQEEEIPLSKANRVELMKIVNLF